MYPSWNEGESLKWEVKEEIVREEEERAIMMVDGELGMKKKKKEEGRRRRAINRFWRYRGVGSTCSNDTRTFEFSGFRQR